MEYEGREKGYAQTMASQLGAFTIAIVQADGMAKDAAAERFLRIVDRENIDIKLDMSIVDQSEPLHIGVNVPPVLITKTGPIEIQEAKISMGMNVKASQESATSVASDTEISGRGSMGWGPIKVSVGLKSSVSVKSDQKRSSDYSAHCDVDVTMGQGDEPEGAKILLDAIAGCLKSTMEMNQRIIEAKASVVEAAIASAPAA